MSALVRIATSYPLAYLDPDLLGTVRITAGNGPATFRYGGMQARLFGVVVGASLFPSLQPLLGDAV
ncbi:MAG: hypothetical protein ABSC64_07515 [Candidatus Korobacteraceae bacterium]|jgi:hypothetical protein